MARASNTLRLIIERGEVTEEYMRVVLPTVTHPADTSILGILARATYAAGVPAEYLRDSWPELMRSDL